MKAVIFDLDGVVCHTDNYHYLAWKQTADDLGIEFDEKINERLKGVSRMESLNIILENSGREYSMEEKEELAEKKNRIYVSLLENMTGEDLDSNVKRTLDILKSRDILLAIGSSSKNTKLILNKLGLDNFFDAVSDGTNIVKSKPDPEVFLKAAEMLRVAPSEALVVEDAASGIEAACSGGFKSAGIGDAAKNEKTTFPIEKIWEILLVV